LQDAPRVSRTMTLPARLYWAIEIEATEERLRLEQKRYDD
jgi:hypothetical protein